MNCWTRESEWSYADMTNEMGKEESKQGDGSCDEGKREKSKGLSSLRGRGEVVRIPDLPSISWVAHRWA
jgi:hypothetical protein